MGRFVLGQPKVVGSYVCQTSRPQKIIKDLKNPDPDPDPDYFPIIDPGPDPDPGSRGVYGAPDPDPDPDKTCPRPNATKTLE